MACGQSGQASAMERAVMMMMILSAAAAAGVRGPAGMGPVWDGADAVARAK